MLRQQKLLTKPFKTKTMDLKIKLEQLHQKVVGLKDQIGTEEATKNAFVMPFIQILGYDIFNPTEVIPEHICDIGTKKGEKIDYVIKKMTNPLLSSNANTGKKMPMLTILSFIVIFMFQNQDLVFLPTELSIIFTQIWRNRILWTRNLSSPLILKTSKTIL